MKVRFLFKDYEISDSTKQQLLYGAAVLVSILSVFSIIFMLSYYSEDPTQAALPSPSTSAFTQNLNQPNQNPQVAGAQTQNQPPIAQDPSGPSQPSAKPSSSPRPSPSPSPTPTSTPTPTPSPSPSPSPTPTPEPSATPDNRPKITEITESDKTDSGIKLKFKVDKSSDCKAIYWTDSNTKKEQESSTKRTTTPEITLTGLTSATEYTYQIECKDSDNGSTSNVGDYKFKTN